MIYLNDFAGGETKFYVANGFPRLTVAPQRGMALLQADVMYSAP